MKNALCVANIGALLMDVCQTITVGNKMIAFSLKLNPITRFIPQKLFRIVWYSDSSEFNILKCPSLKLQHVRFEISGFRISFWDHKFEHEDKQNIGKCLEHW